MDNVLPNKKIYFFLTMPAQDYRCLPMFDNSNRYLECLVVILGNFPLTGLVDIAFPINDDNCLAEIVNF